MWVWKLFLFASFDSLRNLEALNLSKKKSNFSVDQTGLHNLKLVNLSGNNIIYLDDQLTSTLDSLLGKKT